MINRSGNMRHWYLSLSRPTSKVWVLKTFLKLLRFLKTLVSINCDMAPDKSNNFYTRSLTRNKKICWPNSLLKTLKRGIAFGILQLAIPVWRFVDSAISIHTVRTALYIGHSTIVNAKMVSQSSRGAEENKL